MLHDVLGLTGIALVALGFWLTRPAQGARASLSARRVKIGLACALLGAGLSAVALGIDLIEA